MKVICEANEFYYTLTRIELIEEEISKGNTPKDVTVVRLFDDFYNDILGLEYTSKFGYFRGEDELINDNSYQYHCLLRILLFQKKFFEYADRPVNSLSESKVRKLFKEKDIITKYRIGVFEDIANATKEILESPPKTTSIRLLADNIVTIFEYMLKNVHALITLMLGTVDPDHKKEHRKTAEYFISMFGLVKNKDGEKVSDIRLFRNSLAHKNVEFGDDWVSLYASKTDKIKTMFMSEGDLFMWQLHGIRKLHAFHILLHIQDLVAKLINVPLVESESDGHSR